MNLILASASPRRKEILKKAGYTFEVIPSNYDENISGLIYSKELVENCAQQKALDVQQKTNKDSVIVSADTVVVLNDRILGKPNDKSEAFYMLLELSNQTHFVATSICIIAKNKIIKNTDITHVTFRKLDFSDIENYLKSKKPYDKAGSYGIQDEGFDFVLNIDGKLDNVIGFPTDMFQKMLHEINSRKN